MPCTGRRRGAGLMRRSRRAAFPTGPVPSGGTRGDGRRPWDCGSGRGRDRPAGGRRGRAWTTELTLTTGRAREGFDRSAAAVSAHPGGTLVGGDGPASRSRGARGRADCDGRRGGDMAQRVAKRRRPGRRQFPGSVRREVGRREPVGRQAQQRRRGLPATPDGAELDRDDGHPCC